MISDTSLNRDQVKYMIWNFIDLVISILKEYDQVRLIKDLGPIQTLYQIKECQIHTDIKLEAKLLVICYYI